MLGRGELSLGKGDAGRFLEAWDLVAEGVVVLGIEGDGFAWFSISIVDPGWV